MSCSISPPPGLASTSTRFPSLSPRTPVSRRCPPASRARLGLGAFLANLRLRVSRRSMMCSALVAVVTAIDVIAWYRPQVAFGAVGSGDVRIRRLAQHIDHRRIVVGARRRSVKFGLLGLQCATDVG